jgi:gas vesicle protein
MSDSKSSKFGLGLLFGAVVGGLAAFFLSPQSGPENQKMVAKKIKALEKLLKDTDLEKKVKKIFGEATEEAVDVYLRAKKEFIQALAETKETLESIDKDKVEQVAHETVEILKKEVNREGHEMDKLKEELSKEWKKLAPKKK